MRKILTVILMLSVLSLNAGDKTGGKSLPKVKTLLKAADEAIKQKRNQAQAEVNLVEALKREDITHDNRVDIYQKAYMLEKSLLDVQNMKAYLKQSYDTTAFFSSILNMHRYILACDSMEQIPNEKGVVKMRYRKSNTKNLLAKGVRHNLYVGGRYMTRHNKFLEAYDFFDMYMQSGKSPMLSGIVSMENDTVVPHVVYLATVTAFSAQDYKKAMRYIDLAILTSSKERRKSLSEYKVRCLEALERKVEWREALEQYVKEFPNHDYFYLHLIDACQEKKEWEHGIAISDSLLRVVGQRAIYHLGKAQMYMGDARYEECIASADSALTIDKDLHDAYYNKGIAALNVAIAFSETACNDLHNPKCIQDRLQLQSLYRRALEPMEKLRELEPNDPWRWSEALYRIYLNLNMGAKFAEIEAILDQVQ